MKTIKKAAFIALGLLLSASLTQALVDEGLDGRMRIQPYGPVVVHPDTAGEVHALPYNEPRMRTQPYGPVMVHPGGTNAQVGYQVPAAQGTNAQVGYQAIPGSQGNVPTGYQAPAAGTNAQVGYPANDFTNDLSTNARGYIPPMLSEKDSPILSE